MTPVAPRQQLAELTTVALAADPTFATEAGHLAVERPNDRLICVTVRLDMDHGPMLYRTNSVVAGVSAVVPMRGVAVISPHRPDDQRATICDSLLRAQCLDQLHARG